jgi:sugar lactone lactonase YvrE
MADITGMLQASAGVGGEPSNAWDLSKASADGGSIGWEITQAAFINIYAPGGSGFNDIYISPDGLNAYVSLENETISQLLLSNPWSFSSVTFVRSLNVSGQEGNLTGLDFKPDGTKLYIIGAGDDEVNEYTLSTPWDISTASHVQNFSVATQEVTPESLRFKPDGTKMYVLGDAGVDVNEYSLSTAWDISTASYVQNFSVSAQGSDPKGLFFKSDGTRMYVTGSASAVHQYDLSTPWDISTASYVRNVSVSGQTSNAQGIFFHADGSKFYAASTRDSGGGLSARVLEYSLNFLNVTAQETGPTGLFFKPDGTRVYIVGVSGDDVNEYSLSTAWNLYTASYVQNFSISAQETAPTGLFFKPDGTKMYIVGESGDDVNEYSLSSAWDISTASYVQNFSVATQETSPQDLFFKPDGTKMYIVGDAGNDVNEYTLSTPWNISTASYVQNFSVSGQESTPTGLFFKPDGTRMYVIGDAGDDINEYSLSSAWDISTASFVSLYKPNTNFVNPDSIYFSDDGLRFFVVFDSDLIFAYKIS